MPSLYWDSHLLNLGEINLRAMLSENPVHKELCFYLHTARSDNAHMQSPVAVFLTNCLKSRKRHPLTTALEGRKLGTIKLRYWLPLRRAFLNHWCCNTYLLQTSNISPYKASPHPLQGVYNFDRFARLGWSFPCQKPTSLLSCFRRSQQKHSPRLFWERTPFSSFLMLKNFGDLSPKKKSTTRLTSRDKNHTLTSQWGAGADWSTTET